MFYYSLHLDFICGLMVSREQEELLSTISRHDGSAITCVGAVAHVIDDQDDDGTTSRPINFSSFFLLAFCKFQEESFRFTKSVSECLDRVLWKIIILYYKLMQIVTKEVCAHSSSMAIIYTEK